MTDAATAVRERDTGIARALDHTESKAPGWSSVALAFLHRHARRNQYFIGENVSEAAVQYGIVTPSPRSWGSVFLRAAKLGIIEQEGTGRAMRRHNSICPRWRSNVYTGGSA